MIHCLEFTIFIGRLCSLLDVRSNTVWWLSISNRQVIFRLKAWYFITMQCWFLRPNSHSLYYSLSLSHPLSFYFVILFLSLSSFLSPSSFLFLYLPLFRKVLAAIFKFCNYNEIFKKYYIFIWYQKNQISVRYQ